MSVVWRHDFPGTAGTNGSASAPTVGSAMSFLFSTESTVDGAGNLVGGDAYYDIPTGDIGDGTIKLNWTPPSIFAGDLRLFFHADSATGVPFNTDATCLFMQGGQTIALEDRGPANANDGNLDTGGTAVAGTPIDVWIRLDGTQCRVWFDGNTGTPDLETLSMSRSTGHSGLRIVGATSIINFIEFDNVASSPGGGGPTDPPGITTFRNLRNRYAPKFNKYSWLRPGPAKNMLATSYFDEAVVVADPLYIGAAGAGVVDLGTTAPSARYLGPRTLF